MAFLCRYEEEIARLKRGDEVSEDNRPLLPSATAGKIALAGIQSLQTAVSSEKRPGNFGGDDGRNVRMRENSAGAIGDIANAAMNSAGSLTSVASSSASAYDWLVAYNPKAQRQLSIDLLQSLNFEGVVCCVRFSHSGKFLAASGNRLCSIYDAQSGQKLFSLPHDGVDGGDLYVRSLSFNPSDSLFATGSEDTLIRIWDLTDKTSQTPKLMQTLKGHTQDVYALEFINDTNLVSGSGDQTLKLWQVSSSECIFSISNEPISSASPAANNTREAGITSVALSNDRKFVVTGSLDRFVRVYKIVDSTALSLCQTFDGHADSVYSVAFDSKDSSIISGSLDKTIRTWDFDPTQDGTPGKCSNVLTNHKDFVLSVAMASNRGRTYIVSGSKDRTVQFWDEQSQTQQLSLQGHKNSVISVAISPTGGVFATGSGDGRARIWAFTAKNE